MTEQERKQNTFNIVKKHLLAMKEPCQKEESGSCMYRNEKNSRCAIGVLIPDKLYKSNCESGAAVFLIDKESQYYLKGLKFYWKNNGISINKAFLKDLQKVHDCYFTLKKKHLKLLAKHHNLSY